MAEEWQYIGDDGWRFGTRIRGFIREVRAEVYFDEERCERTGGWIWFLPGTNLQGIERNCLAAIIAAEKAMGITSDAPSLPAAENLPPDSGASPA